MSRDRGEERKKKEKSGWPNFSFGDSHQDEELARLEREAKDARAKHEEEMRAMRAMFEDTQKSGEEQDKRQNRERQESERREDEHRESEARQRKLADKRHNEQKLRELEERDERAAKERAQHQQAIRNSITADRERSVDENATHKKQQEKDTIAWSERNAEANARHAREVAEHKQLLEKQRDQHSERLAKLLHEAELERLRSRERLSEERERRARAYEKIAEETRAKMSYLLDAMARRVWNQKVEAKWAERLGALRTTFNPVENAWNRASLSIVEFATNNAQTAAQLVNCETNLETLLEELQRLAEYARDESEEMRKMATDHPEAAFLCDIQECCEKLERSANAVGDAISTMKDNLTNSMPDTVMASAQEAMSALRDAVDSIPSTSALKEKYSGAHDDSSSSASNGN